MVAGVICAVACSAAFGFYLRGFVQGMFSWTWLTIAGIVAGCGVWATHFMAELAYQPSLPIAYEPLCTVASLLIAVLGMTAGFVAATADRPLHRCLGGGMITGLAVAAMHYIGMSALRVPADIVWRWDYVAASVVVGMAGATAAFMARERLRGHLAWAAPALLLVLAICGLHFTGMTAVTLRADPGRVVEGAVVGRNLLAIATGALAALIFAAALSLVFIEGVARRSTMAVVRSALDTVPAGLSFYDPQGRLIAWNEAMAELAGRCGMTLVAGLERRSLIEAGREAGWLPDRQAADGWAEALAADRSPPIEFRQADGRWFRHESFRTPEGGGVAVLTDVTQQRESARAMAEARDSAEAANRAKSEFLANMSHEIRTPLNGVLGIADVLSRSRLTASQRSLVQTIRSSGEHLNALLSDLLDLARVEAGAAELHLERVELGDLVRGVGRLFQPQADAKGLELVVEAAPEADGPVRCDPVRLRQVLANLVSNALKFTEKGRVAVSLSRAGDEVTLDVSDTGVGFDESSKAMLFARFQQGDTTSTRRHGGAGLGLAICDQYVRLMGGELACRSRPNEGTAFSFTLHLPPLAAAEPPSDPHAAFEPAGMAALRVLVVDDNPVNRQVLQLILDSVGCDQRAVEDGVQAVEAVKAEAFDAIFMDIQMPVMDGFEATRQIRAWEAERGGSRIPILMVSANCLQEHIDAGVAAGADGHVNKPVNVAELLLALQAAVVGGDGAESLGSAAA